MKQFAINSRNNTFLENEVLNNNNLNVKKGIFLKDWSRALFLLFFILGFGKNILGNGVVVSNVTITGQNTTSHYSLINFDISWNNSWRNTTSTNNWDACWVFVKYRKSTETTWNHATLNYVNGTGSGDGHTLPAGCRINTTSDGKGIMIYSSANIIPSTVNYTGAKLRWNYGSDGVADNENVDICVFAIEMVYVPQGSFYVGDGSLSILNGHFESVSTGTALQITSEGALTLGGGGAGSLGNNNASGMATADDFNDVTSKTLPAAFPKGYSGFYCMKYEITQEQYVAFLNKLTYTQQTTRTTNAPNSIAGTGALITNNLYRNGIDIMTSGVSPTTPAKYACNYNNNAIYNENDDGQNIACNYLSWADLAAYLDWAALRPFTELEFEKTCRGNKVPVIGEYPWGNTSATQGYSLTSGGYNNERPDGGVNAFYGNSPTLQGPVRVGCFGQGVNTRASVGAGYCGVLELGGNISERTVTVGSSTGRSFTGSHGNGALNASGNADVSNWPGTDAIGVGFRGGTWYTVVNRMRVSDRHFANESVSTRILDYGGRGVRVCPVP